MVKRPALTIVEMILVLALLALLIIPAVLSVNTYRQKQALFASADILASTLTRAHIYSREAKDQKLWGIRRRDNTTYEMISGAPGNAVSEMEFSLVSPTRFIGAEFEVWFLVDTGEADASETIRLIVPRGTNMQVIVNKSGSVEIR